MRLLALLLLLVACQKQPPSVVHIEEVIMQMPLCIQVAGPLKAEQYDDLDRVVVDVFHEIHTIFNPFNPDSEISYINEAPAHKPLLISEPLRTFLMEVADFVASSKGLFDPTVGFAHKAWIESLKRGELPSKSLQRALQESIGWHNIKLEGRTLTKMQSNIHIDLCGASKGLAVDLLIERLGAIGFKDLYVEWGGEIATRGSHPSGRPWQVAIKGGGAQPLDVRPLKDAAIATSGSYHQQWEIAGDRYCHLMNPMTGAPLKEHPGAIVSATVIAGSCRLADMIATTMMLFETLEEALQWVHKAYPDVWVELADQEAFNTPS